MKSKNMQTRYQLVQTYFINISTTNHRARAVRIHPSRAVFRKDEKFSEPLYILGGNPKKSSSNARKQKAKERGISRSIHTRAIQTMLYHLSLEKLIIIADDNKRECSTLTFAILFLCL
jgi:predicted transcriptional regulator